MAEQQNEEIVLFLGGDFSGIHAQTFANALVAFDEFYRSVGFVISPELEFELLLTQTEGGSFKAYIKAVRKDAKSLLEKPVTNVITPILIGVLFLWLSNEKVVIKEGLDSYIVEKGGEKIVLPKYPAAGEFPKNPTEIVKKASRDSSVRRSAKRLIEACELDPEVKEFDIRPSRAPNTPILPIKREHFVVIRGLPDEVLDDIPEVRRRKYYRQRAIVVTAVLEKTKRKWEFLWEGNKINANILDDNFFDKLANHEYEFGQGDVLTIDLEVEQKLNPYIRAYENKLYHVTKVHSHSKGPKQRRMEF